MVLHSFDELTAKVKGGPRRTVALVGGNDLHALEAVIKAADIVDAVLVGDKGKISEALTQLGQNPGRYEIVEVPQGEHPSVCAAKLIREGRADFLMKGKIMTPDLLKGVLSEEAGLRTGRLMNHVAIFEVPGYYKLLCSIDGGMVIDPDLDKKKQMIENTVEFLHKLGYEKPNVAILAAIEVVNPKMKETLDAEALKKMNEAGELTGCYVEGPISYDVAMDPEIAKIKEYSSPAIGDFDLLVSPQITAANLLNKCLLVNGGARLAGLILGCKVPIVVTSRASSAFEKYNSLALAAGVCGK